MVAFQIDEPVKSIYAEGTALKMSKEKKKRYKDKDDEIALYRLKSAEALAGMQQVKSMISRFEQTQLAELQNRSQACAESPQADSTHSPQYGDGTGEESTAQKFSGTNKAVDDKASPGAIDKSGEHEIGNCGNQQPDGKKRIEAEHKDLATVWEKVLKPVHQRVVEIEHVLFDTTNPAGCQEEVDKLSYDEDLSKITCTGSCDNLMSNNSLKDYNQRVQILKALLEEEQVKSLKLERRVQQSDRKANEAEAELCHFVEEFEDAVNTYKEALTEEVEKNKLLTTDVEKAEDRLAQMEKKFNKKLEIYEEKLTTEQLRSVSEQETTHNSSEKNTIVKGMKIPQQKLHIAPKMINDKQVEYSHLQKEMSGVKEATSDQVKLMKEKYEQRLQNAEEILEEKRKLNLKLVHDMKKSKEKYEATIAHIEADYKHQLNETKSALYKEQKTTRTLYDMQVGIANACNIAQVEGCQQQIKQLKDMLNEERLKYSELQEELRLDSDLKGHVESLTLKLEREKKKNTHLQESAEKACNKMRDMDKRLKKELEAFQESVSSEQQRATARQISHHASVTVGVQTESLENEHIQEVTTLNRQLKTEQEENMKVQNERDKIMVQMQDVEAQLKLQLEECQEKLAKQYIENTSLHDNLNAVIAHTKSVENKYVHQLETLQGSLEEEQKKAATVENKYTLQEAQLKLELEEVKEELVKQKAKNTSLLDELKTLSAHEQSVEEKHKHQLKTLQTTLAEQQQNAVNLEVKNKKLVNVQKELKSELKVCQRLLTDRQVTIKKLTDELIEVKQESTDSILMLMSKEQKYNEKVVDLRNELQKQQEIQAELQADKDNAVSEMTHMESELAKRLDAFKEVFSEEQVKISALESELNTYKQSAITDNALKKEMYELKANNVRLIAEKGNLEIETEQLKCELRLSIQRKVSSTQSLTTLESLQSKESDSSYFRTLDSVLGKESDTSAELGKNVNNNKTHYLANILVLQNQLAEQDACIRNFEQDTYEYMLYQDQKDELCRAYIRELEQVKGLNAERINQLQNVVRFFEITFAENRKYGVSKGSQTTLMINDDYETPDHQLPSTSIGVGKKGTVAKHLQDYRQEVKDLQDSNQLSPPARAFHDGTRMAMDMDNYKRDIKGLEERSQLPTSTNAFERQWRLSTGISYYRHDMKALEDQGKIKHTTYLADDLETTGPVQTHTDTKKEFMTNTNKVNVFGEDFTSQELLNRMQELEQQWKLPAKFSAASDFNLPEQKANAICALFEMFSELLTMSVLSADGKEKLVTGISEITSVMHKMQDEVIYHSNSLQQYERKIRQVKQEYEEKLLENENKLHFAKQMSSQSANTSEVAHLQAQVAEMKASVQEQVKKEVKAYKLIAEEQIFELRGQLRKSKNALEDALHEQKECKGKADEMKYQLQIKNQELGKKSRELQCASNSITELQQERERERYATQRDLVKHHSDLQHREAEIRKNMAEMKRLEDKIDQLIQEKHGAEQMHKDDIRNLQLEYDEKKRDTNSELTQLRCQLKVAEYRAKKMEHRKDSEITKITAKLDKAHDELRRLQQDQVICMEDCQNKVNALQKKLDAHKNSQGPMVKENFLKGLSTSNAGVVCQVESMMRTMQTVEEQLRSNGESKRDHMYSGVL